MPAAELIRYCSACDERRAALAEAAADAGERAAILRDHPRHLATKTDVDGKPVCARCLESHAQHRKASFYSGRDTPQGDEP